MCIVKMPQKVYTDSTHSRSKPNFSMNESITQEENHIFLMYMEP